MESDDLVDPGDAALQALLASVAERTYDVERRDRLLDYIRSADGLAELRSRMAAHPATRVQALQAVSDLRLHDVLTW
jgi:hypothetical protein